MFREKLIELRIRNGYRKADIAKMLNITQAGYDRYEKGTSEPNIETIIKLSNIYKVSCDYLLKGQEDRRENEEIIRGILKEAELRIINDVYSENEHAYIQ